MSQELMSGPTYVRHKRQATAENTRQKDTKETDTAARAKAHNLILQPS